MNIYPELIEVAAIAIFYGQVGLTAPYPLWEDTDSEEKAKCRRDAYLALAATSMATHIPAKAWDEGVKTALNYAIQNEDGMTLRLEHLDGRPWVNPYSGKTS